MVKSEVVPVRFDPLLKWAVEIAGALERRSFSSTVERAAEVFVKTTKVEKGYNQQISIWDIANQCWHSDPLFRLYKFAKDYPELLTFEERNQWQAILFMAALERKLSPDVEYPDLVDVHWLADMSKVWPYIASNTNNLDMSKLRDLYLEARES